MSHQPKTNTDVEHPNVIQGESIFTFNLESNKKYSLKYHTAIPYRASTGPEQGFSCEVFPPREKPFFITGISL